MISKESIKRFLMSLSEDELVMKWQYYFGDSGKEVLEMAEVDVVIRGAIKDGSEDIVIVRLDRRHKYYNINLFGGFYSFMSIFDDDSPFDIDDLTDIIFQEESNNH